MTPEIIEALTPLATVLETLNIPYCIGGSVASSWHGHPRATNDIDLIAVITSIQVPQLVTRLQGEYFIQDSMIQEAIRYNSSFNIIHLATGLKVDIFIARDTSFGSSQMARVVQVILPPGQKTFPLASIEDTIIAKLDWYHQGGAISHRQWNDILGMLKNAHSRLDMTYLREMSTQTGVIEILNTAISDAGIE